MAPRRPESVLVLVYAGDGQVLLLKRVSPFSFWQSVTGSIDAGETPQDAARRELAEETGFRDEGELIDTGHCRVFEIDPRWRHRYAPGVTENREYEWRYRLPSRMPVSIDSHEHSAYRWADIDDAIESVWSWTNRAALEALKSQLRGNSQPV